MTKDSSESCYGSFARFHTMLVLLYIFMHSIQVLARGERHAATYHHLLQYRLTVGGRKRLWLESD
jgi:hypothetical protein